MTAVQIRRASVIATLGAVLAATLDSQAQTIGADFNGDGFADLPIGIPLESVGSVQSAGAVALLYGTVNGLVGADNELWHQNRPGVLDEVEANDQFGSSLAWEDFDGDGYDDLAIGSPNERIGIDAGAGAVSVLYGSASGLSHWRDQFWHQDRAGVTDAAESNDHFGSAITAGDFNNDGYGDLAIGVPDEEIGVRTNCGAIQVLYGSSNGLRAAGSRFIHMDTAGMAGVAWYNDSFGSSLAHGDFDSDGFDDLAVGIPGKGHAEGAVHVLYGSAIGLLVHGNRVFTQAQLPAGATDGRMGSDVAAGDFDGNGCDDLAVGMPTSIVSNLSSGAVGVFYGFPDTGLSATESRVWHLDSPGVEGGPHSPPQEPPDNFGGSVAAGDFNADGLDDLAIGEPQDTLSGMTCGSVTVLVGTAGGLTGIESLYLHQDTPFMPGGNLDGDLFGWSIGIGDFDGDGIADLVIGVPGEKVRGAESAGAVIVTPGSATGLSPPDSQYWTQNIAGILDIAETGDRFSFGSFP